MEEKKKSREGVVWHILNAKAKVTDKLSVKAAGVVLGSAASAIAKPCLQFYDGVREGFNQKAPPPRE